MRLIALTRNPCGQSPPCPSSSVQVVSRRPDAMRGRESRRESGVRTSTVKSLQGLESDFGTGAERRAVRCSRCGLSSALERTWSEADRPRDDRDTACGSRPWDEHNEIALKERFRDGRRATHRMVQSMRTVQCIPAHPVLRRSAAGRPRYVARKSRIRTRAMKSRFGAILEPPWGGAQCGAVDAERSVRHGRRGLSPIGAAAGELWAVSSPGNRPGMGEGC